MRVTSEADYLALFDDATSQHVARGECSTLYLLSECAIRDSLAWNPEMKYIFMLRCPTDIAHAYHMQMRFHEFEDLADFQSAWDAQKSRRDNPGIVPRRCREPRLLQYSQVASIGTHLKNAMELIDPKQLHVILFEDFANNTRLTYESVLHFLGVPSDSRKEFPKDNVAMKSRNALLTRMLRSSVVHSTSLVLKKRLRGRAYRWARTAKHTLMFRKAARPSLDADFEKTVHKSFVPQIEMLEELLKRDLSHWKTPNIS